MAEQILISNSNELYQHDAKCTGILPKLYLNGTQTKSGEYLLPSSIVFLVLLGGIITVHFNALLRK